MASFTPRLQELNKRMIATTDQKFNSNATPNDHRINVEHEMGPYRSACQKVILGSVMAARKHMVDSGLWGMHTRCHGKFRSALQKLVNHKQQTSPLHRKTVDEYTKFIKASQTSYKSLLCNIDAQYPTISTLRNIAQSIASPNSVTSAPPPQAGNAAGKNVSDELKKVIITLVYETLLHLGDLSRWRYVAHLGKTGEAEWKAAAIYYQLAYEVLPSSGFAKHQEAVLALGDTKYFYALSHLYQSLCAQIQHPEASQNLDLLLRKRLSIPMNELIQAVKPRTGGNTIATLRAWFLRFHVECYQGVEFSAHEEMESEILVRLSNALKNGTDLSSTLFHMVIISIAGEYVAVEKAQREIEPVKNAQAYFFLLRHNVKLFREILLHLYDKLEGQSRENVASLQEPTGKLPPVAEVTMFAVRLYSLWFSKNWPFLQKCMDSGKPDASTSSSIRELWAIYAAVLNAIYEQYPLFDIISTGDMEYLLKEEEATMGFLPLHGDSNADVWTRDGKAKSVLRKEKSAEDQEQEHLIRLRDIFTRGLIIAQDPSSPYILAGNKIVVNEAGTTSELFSPTLAQEHEGEPITPPPTAGGDDIFLAPTEEEQYGLWYDGANDAPPQNPNQRKPAITVEQLVQKAYYPPVMANPGIQAPKQMPWILLFPYVDGLWRNDHVTATNLSQWSHQPFGQQRLYPDGT